MMEGDDLFIEYLEKKNITLKIVIIQNKIKYIGKIKPTIKKLDLNADRKRQWFGKLTGIDESHNDSMPSSLNWITKKISRKQMCYDINKIKIILQYC